MMWGSAFVSSVYYTWCVCFFSDVSDQYLMWGLSSALMIPGVRFFTRINDVYFVATGLRFVSSINDTVIVWGLSPIFMLAVVRFLSSINDALCLCLPSAIVKACMRLAISISDILVWSLSLAFMIPDLRFISSTNDTWLRFVFICCCELCPQH